MNNELISIYEKGYEFLQNYVSKEVLEAHLNSWEKQNTISGLYEKMLHHGQNWWRMPRIIDFEKRKDKFKLLLESFEPKDVINKFTNPQDIQSALDKLIDDGKINRAGGKWEGYSKTIYYSAKFLAQFKDADHFYDYFEKLSLKDPYGLSAPFEIVSKNIYGYKLAISCDYLKEIGFQNLVKPDLHIKRLAFELGISQSDNEVEVFKSMVDYAKQIGVTPYRLDKVLFLIGSGNFYLKGFRIHGIRKEFMRSLIPSAHNIAKIEHIPNFNYFNVGITKQQNDASLYNPKEFEQTHLFQKYSPFCQQVLKNLNNRFFDNMRIDYKICTRNGKDTQITFTVFSPSKRNLITIKPNSNLDYIKKIEIRDKNNKPNPFEKEIYSLEDLNEVEDRVRILLGNMSS